MQHGEGTESAGGRENTASKQQGESMRRGNASSSGRAEQRKVKRDEGEREKGEELEHELSTGVDVF